MKKGFRALALLLCFCMVCGMTGCTLGKKNETQPTKAPVNTQTPELTGMADRAQAPETTGMPDGVQAPELTGMPDGAQIPELTGMPDGAQIPELTGMSDGAQASEAAKTPDPAKTPDGINEAEPTNVPGTAPTKAPDGGWEDGGRTEENYYNKLLGEWVLYRSESGDTAWFAADAGEQATLTFRTKERVDYHFTKDGEETIYQGMEAQFVDDPFWGNFPYSWAFLLYPSENTNETFEVSPNGEFLIAVCSSDEDDVIMTFRRGGKGNAEAPTEKPTDTPTPTEKPMATVKPTNTPTVKPANTPTEKPTNTPTEKPTNTPTEKPTNTPTPKPSPTPILKKGEIVYDDKNAVSLPGIDFGDGMYSEPYMDSVENVYTTTLSCVRNSRGFYSFPANLPKEDMLAAAERIAELPGVSRVEIKEQERYPSCSLFGVGVTYDGLLFYLYAQQTGDTSLLDENGKEAYAKAVQIVKSAEKYTTDYEKEVFFHDYLVKNIKYDTFDEKETGQTPYGGLVLGRCVCTGYATSMRLLLLMAGIDCLEVWGTSKGQSHVWNKVNIDGEWYNVDVTWDDPVGSTDPNAIQYQWMNITDAEMRIDHTWDNTGLPVCMATEYNYLLREKLLREKK